MMPMATARFRVSGALLALVAFSVAHAAGGTRTWQPLPDYRPSTATARQTLEAFQEAHVFRLHQPSLLGSLRGAPRQSPRVNIHLSPNVVELPLGDGRIERFRVIEAPILDEALQAQRPHIRTFLIQGLDDPTATGRIGLTIRGFHGIVLKTDRVSHVFRVDPARPDDYVAVYAHHRIGEPGEFGCQAIPHPEGLIGEARDDEEGLEIAQTGRFVRRYRVIVSSTGELTQLLGGIPQAEARIVELLNPVVAIYERDFAMSMTLVAFNVQDDPVNDDFRNGASVNNNLLQDNINSLNRRFGSGAYDVGHVLCPGGGGVAFLRATCTSNKGGGVSGASGRDNVYHIGVLAHEFGHQFGANHSFNSTVSPCGSNRNSSTAYEPGSGSTIMAYPGLCGTDNVVSNFDLYFHTISYSETLSWRNSTGGTCGTQIDSGNNPPTVNPGPNRTIPRNTPFVLSAIGSDPDPQDVLTYTFEQFDLGTTDTTRPIFRSRFPSTSNRRFLPPLDAVLANQNPRWEPYVTVNRTIRFRATVRDNRAGSGGSAFALVTYTVSGDPFFVTSPNGGETWTAGEQRVVTWTVGGGSVASSVDIVLSTTGGLDFATGNGIITLATAVPNTGSATITVPNVDTNRARLFVVARDNIFYDVSNGDFTIRPPAEQVVLPDSYQVTFGREIGPNDPNKLRNGNDADPVVIGRAPAPFVGAPSAELIAQLAVPAGNPLQSGRVEVRYQIDAPPVTASRGEILLRDWSTGQLEVVSAQNPILNNGFNTITVVLSPSQLARFVRSDGAVEVALRTYQLAPTAITWTTRISLVRLVVVRNP